MVTEFEYFKENKFIDENTCQILVKKYDYIFENNLYLTEHKNVRELKKKRN